MALWPWREPRFLDRDEEEWQKAVWGWFLANLGGLEELRRAPLVTPTRAFFPPIEATGHARAVAIFDKVKEHADMTNWPCRLVAQERRPDVRVGEVASIEFEKHDPLGTFAVEESEILVTYDPALLDNPMAMVATLAHELGHYLLGTCADLPPGEEDTEELATDLTTIFLGFGLFGANSAFAFRQYGDGFSQGWQSTRQGYLSERLWCYGLAIFFVLRGDDIEQAKPFLKAHLYGDLRKAAAYLRRHPDRLPVVPPPAEKE